MSNAIIDPRSYTAIAKLVAHVLDNDMTIAQAQSILERTLGKQGKVTYGHLRHLKEVHLANAAEKQNIDVLPVALSRVMGALSFIDAKAPVCTNCQSYTITDEGGRWHNVQAGSSCPSCNEYIRPSTVVTERINWTNGTKVGIDLLVDRNYGGEPVPLTSVGISAFLAENGLSISPIIAQALMVELKNASDALERYVNTLFCHPQFASKFSGGGPLQVLGALANPLVFGLARNDLIRVGELAQQQWWTKHVAVSASPSPILAGGSARSVLRRRLEQELRSANDLDAFVLDYFPKVHSKFTIGMDRTQRTSLLFEQVDLDEIRDCLNILS